MCFVLIPNLPAWLAQPRVHSYYLQMARHSVLERNFRRRGESMGRMSRILRASLAAIVFISFIWFLFVGILGNPPTKRTTATTARSNSKLMLLKLIGTERHAAVYWNSDINYVSKRRVPSGPDPIHNRYVMYCICIHTLISCIYCCTCLVFLFFIFIGY